MKKELYFITLNFHGKNILKGYKRIEENNVVIIYKLEKQR